MDMTSARATLTTTPVGGVSCGGLNTVPLTKSPEAESETPPRIQPPKPLSFSNGVLKRHAPPQVVYKECLKNHAASLGGHALDGCGEFMPAPNATASDPTSLKCAACGCHRNFHRREPDELTAGTPTNGLTHVIEYHPHHRHHPLPPPHSTPVQPRGTRSPGSQSPPPISSTYYPGSAPHMLLALSSGVGGGPTEATTPTTNGPHHQHIQPQPQPQVPLQTQQPQQQQHHVMMNSGTSSHGAGSGSRKRFRTKFSQEQKDKMHEFAEKVGWKMQKINEDLVNGFCSEIGVERGVFKVWMHNNKNTFGKQPRSIIITPTTSAATITGAGAGGDAILGAVNHGLNEVDDDSMDDDGDDDEDDGDEIGNGNGNGNINNRNSHHHHHIIHHHHHHHNQQQYNNGGKIISESNAAPTNGSSSSS